MNIGSNQKNWNIKQNSLWTCFFLLSFRCDEDVKIFLITNILEVEIEIKLIRKKKLIPKFSDVKPMDIPRNIMLRNPDASDAQATRKKSEAFHI